MYLIRTHYKNLLTSSQFMGISEIMAFFSFPLNFSCTNRTELYRIIVQVSHITLLVSGQGESWLWLKRKWAMLLFSLAKAHEVLKFIVFQNL